MNWTQFRRDHHNAGTRRNLESPPRPSVAWTADLEGASAESPVLGRDTVYVGTEAGAYAFERETGRYRWPFRTESPVLTPALANGILGVTSADGSVYGLEAETGERTWEQQVSGPISSAPTVHDERLYVGHDGGITAFAIETGERVWTHETESGAVGTPAVYDGRVYVGTRADEVLAVELEPNDGPGGSTGEDADPAGDSDGTVWSAPINGTIVGGPTVVPDDEGGRVYVADDGGLLLAMDAATGQSWFTYESRGAFTSAPTVVGDREGTDAVFVAADDAHLHVTDTQFGTRQVRGWFFSKKGVSLDGATSAEPALAGETICLGDETGSVYGIDADELDFVWHVRLEAGVSGGTAVAADGAYVVTEDDRLVRLAWGERER